MLFAMSLVVPTTLIAWVNFDTSIAAYLGEMYPGRVALMTTALTVGAIALWLGIARACRRGSSGARVAGTVLFAVHTVGVLGVVTSSQAGLGPAKVLTLIGWLIGLGAVLALWQRPSSAFFTARCMSNTTGSSSCTRPSILSSPTPCSPVTVPPSSKAASMISAKAA